jgi:hypothetical protein
MKQHALTHQFVEYIPENLQQDILYISMSYATAAHLCCCGCGKEVVTPFSPTDWTLAFDGETVSLDPSVGNWSFPCRSHYWIRRNRVAWAGGMSLQAIEAWRVHDRIAKTRQYGSETDVVETDRALPKVSPMPTIQPSTLFKKLLAKFKGVWV